MYRIAWLPENLNNNKSFFGFKKATVLAGAENITEKELYENPRAVDYLILNFYEDIQKKIGFHVIAYVGRIIRLFYFKFCGIKIVWIVNNKVPHDDNKKWAIRMMKRLIKASYKIIILCNDSLDVLRTLLPEEKKWKDKVFYLPHPNYIGSYNESDFLECSNDDVFHILFFGSIRPYKNVDVLIKAFNEVKNDKMTLTIAGGCKNSEYKKYIQSLASKSPIQLILEYIDDDDIMSLILKNTIMVFPYDNETTLNSGSVILACSAAKTFISPNIGTVKDFSDKTLFYTYDYSDEQDHIEKLAVMLRKAYDDFIENRKILVEKGQKLKQYMMEKHSTEVLAKIFKEELFTELN